MKCTFYQRHKQPRGRDRLLGHTYWTSWMQKHKPSLLLTNSFIFPSKSQFLRPSPLWKHIQTQHFDFLSRWTSFTPTDTDAPGYTNQVRGSYSPYPEDPPFSSGSRETSPSGIFYWFIVRRLTETERETVKERRRDISRGRKWKILLMLLDCLLFVVKLSRAELADRLRGVHKQHKTLTWSVAGRELNTHCWGKHDGRGNVSGK